jgi:hypothetical protein
MDLLCPGGRRGESVLERVYAWPPLRALVEEVIGVKPLFPLDDPLGAVSLNVFHPGNKASEGSCLCALRAMTNFPVQHSWHLDESTFTVLLMLQPAEKGGAFSYTAPLSPGELM